MDTGTGGAFDYTPELICESTLRVRFLFSAYET